MSGRPSLTLFWRLFLTHLGAGLLLLLLAAASATVLVERQRQNRFQHELPLLIAAVNRPDLPTSGPGGEARAYLARTPAGRVLLMDRSAFAAAARGRLTPAVFLAGGESRLEPEEVTRTLLPVIRSLTDAEINRLLEMAHQLTRSVPINGNGGPKETILFAPVPDHTPVERVAVAFFPPGPLEALLFEGEQWLWPIAGLGLLLAAASAWLLARSITWPLGEVSRVAELAARGDLSQRVPVAAQGEIGRVVQIFNLALDQLAEAQVRFERAEQSRRDLVASVSHEFRAPLASLRGYLELIRDGVIGPEEQGRYLDVMLTDTLRVNRLVEDLLDLARIQARQVGLRLVAVDPAQAIHRAVEQISWRVSGTETRLVADPQPDLPPVRADRDRLDQVLTNLLDNALRYAGATGWVRLSARQDAGFVIFSVHDSGPGIPLEEQGRVWERFYKVEKARTPTNVGSGLGLAIVKELVEAMGGQVGLTSQPGRGAAFWLTIPIASPDPS